MSWLTSHMQRIVRLTLTDSKPSRIAAGSWSVSLGKENSLEESTAIGTSCFTSCCEIWPGSADLDRLMAFQGLGPERADAEGSKSLILLLSK